MKKPWICLAGIFLAAACLSGCQQKDPKPGDVAGYDPGEEYLSIWVHSIEDTEEGQAYRESVESFNEAFDGKYFADIEFVPRNDSGGGYSDKVNASVMSGGLPDVLTVDGPNVSAYAANGIIQLLGLEEYRYRKPKNLSGGQRQRVALGRAIVKNQKVFLMDEPLSNLDAKLRNQMRAEIIKLRHRIDTTFIYVTHDQTEAMTLGDRIVIMKDGFIQQIGTPQEVFDHPANLFVAGFIGTPQMNFFDAELVKQDGRYAVVLDGMTVVLSDEKQERLAAHGVAAQHVTLGVRPQHISLQGDSTMVKARMDVFEMMGSEIHLHATMNGRDMVIIVPTMDISGDYADAFTIGKEVDFTFSGSACHVFGSDGKNLEF